MDLFRMVDKNAVVEAVEWPSASAAPAVKESRVAKTPQANLPNCPKCHGSLSMGEWMGGLCLRCGNAIP